MVYLLNEGKKLKYHKYSWEEFDRIEEINVRITISFYDHTNFYCVFFNAFVSGKN